MTEQQAAQTYVSDVARVNDARAVFHALAEKWDSSTTNAQAQAAAAPLVNALDAVQPKAQSLAADYPAAATQIGAVVSAVMALNNDLSQLANLKATIDVNPWSQRYDSDRAALTTASNALRSALGLQQARHS